MHTVFVVAVQAVFTPVAHVDAQGAQGVVPAADQVDPATHTAAAPVGEGAGAVVEDGDGAVDGHVSAAQSDTIVKAALLFHASAILRLLHVVSDVAKEKVVTSAFIPPAEGVEPKLVTLVTSHEAKPIPVKLDASLNV